jgi:serine phosphatase RsbU (regulator of sigma subunit)
LLAFIRKYQLQILLGVGSWVMLLAETLHATNSHPYVNSSALFNTLVNDLVLFVFLFTNFLLIRQGFNAAPQQKLKALLTQILGIGGAGLVLLSIAIGISLWTVNTPIEFQILAIRKSIGLYVFVIFLFSLFYTYRRIIFYIPSKIKYQLWKIFEILQIFSILLIFEHDTTFLIPIYFKYFLFIVNLAFCIYFSTYIRWVAYLSIKEKIVALLLLFGVFVLFVLFLIIEGYITEDPIELLQNLFIFKYSLLGMVSFFILIYTLYAILVLLFNLPTTSLLENSLTEMHSIRKINQSIEETSASETTIRTLADVLLKGSESSAVWIELETNKEIVWSQGIQPNEIEQITQGVNYRTYVLDTKKYYYLENLNIDGPLSGRFRSLLVLPIQTNQSKIGAAFLLKNINSGYTSDHLRVLTAFADQAALALSNMELSRKAIVFERYQEQLAIAKQMQSKLYPSSFPDQVRLNIHAVSHQAEEIGGDYYDVIESSDHQFRILMGDVSGKGTTAALYMAQLKGIFQALGRIGMDGISFMDMLNRAISACLGKGMFITAAYLRIDIPNQKAEHFRAGHCPTFFWDAKNKKLERLEEKGLGLGILRNEHYREHLFSRKLDIAPGDRFFMYTDGIVESRNTEGEEFGYERLESCIQKNIHLSITQLSSVILLEVERFSGMIHQDDLTLMIVEIPGNLSPINSLYPN